jgi:hypothetical protein
MVMLFLCGFLLKHRYGNVPVALLPFVPFKVATMLTHRGLLGPETECSVHFLDTLLVLAIRETLPKLLPGHSVPRNVVNPLYNVAAEASDKMTKGR